MPTGSARDVAVVTPWYPTNKTPFGGSFVASMVDAVAPQCDRIQIIHTDGWGVRYSAAEDARVWAARAAGVMDDAATLTGHLHDFADLTELPDTDFIGQIAQCGPRRDRVELRDLQTCPDPDEQPVVARR